ncbi:hypothetical protein ABC319_14340 [Sphingomonas sp. 1P08PE]
MDELVQRNGQGQSGRPWQSPQDVDDRHRAQDRQRERHPAAKATPEGGGARQYEAQQEHRRIARGQPELRGQRDQGRWHAALDDDQRGDHQAERRRGGRDHQHRLGGCLVVDAGIQPVER